MNIASLVCQTGFISYINSLSPFESLSTNSQETLYTPILLPQLQPESQWRPPSEMRYRSIIIILRSPAHWILERSLGRTLQILRKPHLWYFQLPQSHIYTLASSRSPDTSITFIVDSRGNSSRLLAYKKFVCAASEIFDAAFNSSLTEGDTQTYTLDDTTTQALFAFIAMYLHREVVCYPVATSGGS